MTAREFHKLPPKEQRGIALKLDEELVRNAFAGDSATPVTVNNFKFEALFGLYDESGTPQFSDKYSLALYRYTKTYPEAWDAAETLVNRLLSNKQPLPEGMALYVKCRLEGTLARPEERPGRGNKRDRNLYRNYFIVETLQKLEVLGYQGRPAREIIGDAFKSCGYRMITVSTVHHVQREQDRYKAEFNEFRLAEEAYRLQSSP